MPREERSFRTSALILKRRDFGESDRLLTVLTPLHGKVNAIAKGARKPTSKKTGHVELFTHVDMLINRGRDLFIVSQAEVTKPYLKLRDDLRRSAYASYITELTTRFILDEDTNTQTAFELLDSAFGWLNDGDDPRLAVRYFEMHLLDDVGFRPELNECVFTHEPILPQDQHFSFGEGGAVSPKAAQFAQSLVPISVMLLKLLRHIQRSPYSHVRSLTITDSLHMEAERLLHGYITYVLESRLQSVDFIRRIRQIKS